jgi:hypothetical protein
MWRQFALPRPSTIAIAVPITLLAARGVVQLIEAFERVYNLRVTHRMKEAQARILEAQATRAERDLKDRLRKQVPPDAFGRRQEFDPVKTVEGRLRKARVRVIDVDLEFEDPHQEPGLP